jgi:hypothetical protein
VKIIKISKANYKEAGYFGSKKYPYYIAIIEEGLLKGQYPPKIRYIPHMRQEWDRGGFGTGSRMTELTNTNPMHLIQNALQRGEDPRRLDYYIVRYPNAPREKIDFNELRQAVQKTA